MTIRKIGHHDALPQRLFGGLELPGSELSPRPGKQARGLIQLRPRNGLRANVPIGKGRGVAEEGPPHATPRRGIGHAAHREA